MCGIAGIISFPQGISSKNNIRPDLAKTALLMNDTLRHRGPDGEGYLLIREKEEIPAFGKDTPQSIIHSSILHRPSKALENMDNVKGILAHRRLSIIDISPTGHQPLCNTARSLWIVFNGEIYNYIELRDELGGLGHKFHTSSDTEVILAAYNEWSYGCVNRFNGMWSFVIYDESKNQLFASRDRFGVKPFYYCKNDNIFAFASEQKALLKSGVAGFAPNDKAVFDYWLFTAMEEQEEGMFKGIYELFPGYNLIVDLYTGELQKWKYFTLLYPQPETSYSPLEVMKSAEKIQSLFMESVRLRLRSDVEVASCLSGGLDSSSIVSAIYKLTGKGLNTFTTSFKDPAIDESSWAKIVSDYTHSQAHYTFPTSAELAKDLHDLIYCQDIPLWNTSTYAQFRVMKLINENRIKVVLDGQGGDELFAGYGHHYFYYLRDIRKQKGRTDFLKQAIKTKQLRRYYIQTVINNYINTYSLSRQLRFHLRMHPELKYLNRDFLHRNQERLIKVQDAYNLNEALYKDFNNTLLKTYLRCEDRCSMWHSVESRTPFSDDINLIEYAFSLPSTVKVVNGELKSILRKSLQTITPKAIIERKDKKGYMTPNRQWIADIRKDVKYLFENPVLSEYLDTKRILKDYEYLFNQPNKPDNPRIFKLIAFAKWMEIFSGS
jgi:asparagine synthase (glutamine-hydrolysing)